MSESLAPDATAAQTPANTATDAVATQARLAEISEDALAPASELPIRLPSFEGPLDLLLFLIRRNEIDIYDIPIESVTKQYMEVIHSMEELNLELAGDFFVMAATLMYIKSRMLLPTNEQVAQPQEEEEEADPRWELVQQLLEYKKYKEAAMELQQLVERQQDFLLRNYQEPAPVDSERDLESSDRIDIWNTFNKVLRRLSDRIVRGEIQDEEISIAQSMEYILDTLQTRSQFRFTELLEGKRLTVAFLVSTFLAILELTRLKRLYIAQNVVFGDIQCIRRDNPEDEGEDVIDEPTPEKATAAVAATVASSDDNDALPSGSAAASQDADDSEDDGDSEDDDHDAQTDDDADWDYDNEDEEEDDDFDWDNDASEEDEDDSDEVDEGGDGEDDEDAEGENGDDEGEDEDDNDADSDS